MNNERLGSEEYRVHVYENISKIIVNRNYIEENFDFFEKIVFKSWELYYYDSHIEHISITKQIRMLEIFLSAMIEMKPDLYLPEDII